jgi:hypothetical protein
LGYNVYSQGQNEGIIREAKLGISTKALVNHLHRPSMLILLGSIVLLIFSLVCKLSDEWTFLFSILAGSYFLFQNKIFQPIFLGRSENIRYNINVIFVGIIDPFVFLFGWLIFDSIYVGVLLWSIYQLVYRLFQADVDLNDSKELPKDSFLRLIGNMRISVLTMIVIPFLVVTMRNIMFQRWDSESVAIWEAYSSLGTSAFSIISVYFMIIYLPIAAECKSRDDLKLVIFKQLKILVPTGLILASLGVFCFDWILPLIYGDYITDHMEYLMPVAVGEILKMIYWVLTYPLVALGKWAPFLTIQGLVSISYLCLTLGVVYFLGIAALEWYGIVRYGMAILITLLFRNRLLL